MALLHEILNEAQDKDQEIARKFVEKFNIGRNVDKWVKQHGQETVFQLIDIEDIARSGKDPDQFIEELGGDPDRVLCYVEKYVVDRIIRGLRSLSCS